MLFIASDKAKVERTCEKKNKNAKKKGTIIKKIIASERKKRNGNGDRNFHHTDTHG